MVPRRTMVVWGALVGSMTICAGLLFWLEPRPAGTTTNTSLSLAAVDTPRGSQGGIFDRVQDLRPGQWNRIVIHHSGQDTGNANTISDLHDALGYGSLGYHFVIGNGHGSADGRVQIGPRWVKQTEGAYVPGAISICLVGNGDRTPPTRDQVDRLVQLIETLRQRLDIPYEQVILHGDVAQTTSPGRHFPEAAFKLRLLGLAAE